MTSHAPSPNFVQTTITVTSPVADAPTVLTSARPRQPGSPHAQPVAHHPCLREREGGEDPDHVEVDEAVGVRLVDDEQRRRGRGEHEHPVREDEPVAEVRELPRREAIPREQRREPREALERGVGREHEDEQRRPLDGVVHEAAEGARREDGARDLGDDRVGRARHRVDVHREIRDAEEHRDRDRPEHGERRRGVLPLRVPEGVDAVRDRLHAREGGRAGRERAQEDEDGDHAGPGRQRVGNDRRLQMPGQVLDEPDRDEDEDRGDERVRREARTASPTRARRAGSRARSPPGRRATARPCGR